MPKTVYELAAMADVFARSRGVAISPARLQPAPANVDAYTNTQRAMSASVALDTAADGAGKPMHPMSRFKMVQPTPPTRISVRRPNSSMV